MNTQVSRGKALEIIAAAAIASGQPVLVGSIVGIAANKYNIGDTAVIWLMGAHNVPKAAGTAWSQGEPIYWDSTANNFTTVASTGAGGGEIFNTLAGYAYSNQLAADVTGVILLRQ